jgi:hypothetical protein
MTKDNKKSIDDLTPSDPHDVALMLIYVEIKKIRKKLKKLKHAVRAKKAHG